MPAEWSGPLARTAVVAGAAVRVSFDHLRGGLVATVGRLDGFQIAGADRRFVRADATVDGETVLVSSPLVSAPRAVRYAWDDDAQGTVANAAGLPASPFELTTTGGPATHSARRQRREDGGTMPLMRK